MPRESKANLKKRTAAKMRKFHSSAIAAILLLCLAPTLGGCVFYYHVTRVGTPHFSPDGTWLAYGWHYDLDFQIIPGGMDGTVKATNYVSWCMTSRPEARKKLKVDLGNREFWDTDYAINLKFSPDSQHLAFATRHNGITVIHLASGKHWRISPEAENITSIIWLSNDELGYVAHVNIRGQHQEISDRTFWRARIDQPIESRARIYAEKGITTYLSEYYPTIMEERWSPDGKYVVFLASRPNGLFQLLDTTTGKVFTPPQRKSAHKLRGAWWKRDASAVFCLNVSKKTEEAVPFKTDCEALLISPVSGKTLDVSDKFNKAFSNSWPVLFSQAWTPDNQYLLINLSRHGGCLVRPDPWEVIPAGKAFTKQIRKGDCSEITRSMYMLPIPGRLWGESYNSRIHMTDYQGRVLGTYTGSLSDNFKLVFSPDGKLIAATDTWHRSILTIQHVNWTPLEEENAAKK